MKTEDLFPKEYIYSLNSPSNYIGARDIFGDEGSNSEICRILSTDEEDELESLIPMKHKKDYEIDEIPSSMKKAVAVFLLGNVIRDLRGDINAHRSMLINVSRFTDVQIQLGDMLNDELKKFQNAARIHSKLDLENALQESSIKYLYDVFINEFTNIKYSWKEIQKNLYRGIGSVNIKVINQKSKDKLDYEEYENGLRVITIGGLSLSRGLTLEGLMTSYLYRSTRMYDTLLQMGRWFGYRPKYEDLCSIWVTESSRDWYNYISESSDELRRDLKRYEGTGLTPLDFGIRVRSDKNSLLVTARNKMRTSSPRKCTISLSEKTIETTDLFVNKDKTQNNRILIDNLIAEIKSRNINIQKSGKSVFYSNIDKNLILDFLNMLELPTSNDYLDPIAISTFIKQYSGNELEKWDIGFVNGSSKYTFEIENNCKLNYVERSFSVVGNNEDIVRMSGNKKRLGSVSNGTIGIVVDKKKMIDRVFNIENKFGKYRETARALKQDDYFNEEYINQKRKPLLLIYNVKLKYDEEKHKKKSVYERELIKKYKAKEVIGISIGIPKLLNTETKLVTYIVNKTYRESRMSEYDIGDEE